MQPIISEAERAVCRRVGTNPADLLASKVIQSGAYRAARLALANGRAVCMSRASGSSIALSKVELAACHKMGGRPLDLMRSKLRAAGIAIAAQPRDPIIPTRQQLSRAHAEIDRAHGADAESGWRDTPIPTLISRALDGLGAFDPDDAKSYNTFLIGVRDAMRALQLASPDPDPDADKLHAAGSQGLMRAHSEIDRAHAAALSQDTEGQWQKAPMSELIGAAAAGFRSYQSGGDYDDLLLGCLSGMRVLELTAPAYANRRPLPGER